ncbi:MAG: hypothetical protein HND44_05165 [Chloroflexi bacterium]|nr:hypothetical protein [Ardenticatenaceae bacterium]MBL1127884.1 hypothetical protein [Chloroflexota bacterium]NOG33954.1 hypothetical protein [Chloroflexota bacterium]GIK55638.1 MAG: hypothetical protein BroJett015_13010 [Chloroflexota bacterium]
MASPDNIFNWDAVSHNLQREKKAALIHLIQELTAVSPTVQQFLHVRYLHSQDITARVQPYLKRIDAQFGGEETWPDLGQIAQAIQEYQLATRQEAEGTDELYVYTFEVTANFFWGIGIHDVDLLGDVAELAWQCVSHFNNFPSLYPLYVDRLHAIAAKLSEHHWEGLTDPFYQLDADMDDFAELL